MPELAGTAPSLVLLVGAPRSGTTWLQRMLAAHPSVASPQETDLFARYLEPLSEAWRWQQRGGPDAWKDRRYKGLPAVLTNEEFTEITRDYVRGDRRPCRRAAPGRVDRPGEEPVDEPVRRRDRRAHPGCARAAPGARRPGRRRVAPRRVRGVGPLVGAADAAGRRGAWTCHVEGARRAQALGVPYLEVRYEALVGGNAAVLRAAYEHCGIATTDEECRSVLDRHSFDRTAGAADAPGEPEPALTIGGEFAAVGAGWREPEGFNRRGAVAGWTAEWSTRERLQFDAVAGDLLVALGYEPDHRWAAEPMRARVYRFEAAASAAVAKSTRWLGRRGERLAAKAPRA